MSITPLTRRKPEVYSDFYKDLTLSLINFDLARRIDEESIKESIRNLILTDRGERLFQPNIGCDIRKLLFENIGPDTIVVAKELIRTTIESHEPRAALIGVDVLSAIDDNKINIIVTFNIINRQDPISLNITLYRVR
jgi:phage baseplate assembly protein W